MKKRVFGWLLIVLAALVILYLAASWYMGKAGHDKLKEYISQINHDIAEQWTDDGQAPEIKIIDYKRGLLSSLVTYQLDYHHDKSATETILLIDKLSHGPFPLVAISQGNFTPLIAYSHIKPMHGGAMKPWYELMQGDKIPWQLDNQYHFNGVVKSDLELASFVDAKQQLEFMGGHASANYDADSGQFELTAKMPGLTFMEASSETLLNLQDIDLDVLTIRGAERALQSHQQLKLSKLEASWSDGLVVSFENPNFVIDSSLNDDLSNSKIDYDLGQILVGDTELGNLQAVLSIDNINTPVLQEIIDIFSDENTDPLFFGEDTELDDRLSALFKKLFAASPAIRLENLIWQTEKANSQISSDLSFKPILTDVNDSFADLIEQSIDEFQLNFDLHKPMILDVLKTQFDDRAVQLFSMFFDHYTARLKRLGLVKLQDQNIEGNLRYTNSLMTVNGNVMSPLEFQERLSSIISP